ncbi:MAG: hypothetical protein HRU34_20960 [Richelia sp.]|nr:hypothetical protein [Richelia sp.]CDN10553.1 unknown protein [Richelia intracellularis]
MDSVELKTVVYLFPKKPAPVSEPVEEEVSKQDIRTSLKASTMNGIFAAIFTVTTSGILLSNFLVELDASPLEVGAYRTNVILLIQIWIVARYKKASKQAEILSHLTTNKTTIFFLTMGNNVLVENLGRKF